MCHIYPDPDQVIIDMQEAVAKEVVQKVMGLHYEKPVPQPDRITHAGLVFIITHPVDIRGSSVAGEKIVQELRSLGFIGIEFFDGPSRDASTAIEYTLTDVARYEQYWADVDRDEAAKS